MNLMRLFMILDDEGIYAIKEMAGSGTRSITAQSQMIWGTIFTDLI